MNAKTFDKTSTNICKGIAILLMYIHHSFYSPDSWKGAKIIFSPLTKGQMISIAQLCKVCVSIFVFLSAYGVYRSSQSRNSDQSGLSAKQYLPTVGRRYLTLLYNFVFIYILTQLLSPVIGISRIDIYGTSRIERIFYTIIDGLGLADALSTPTYNATWWYMSLAFLLILILPLLAKAADYLGYALFPLAVLVPPLLGLSTKAVFFRYLVAIVMGLLCAKYDIFERLNEQMNSGKIKFILYILVALAGTGILLIFRHKLGFIYLLDGIIATLICFLGHTVLRIIPLINQIFALFGKYSMNMFMIHTLIRGKSSNFHALSYAPRYPVLIILLLLVDTLILSIAIEYLKKGVSVLFSKLKRGLSR